MEFRWGPTSRAMVTVPVAGKPTRLDITNEIRAACESLVPPVSETMLELVSRVEPEYQEKVRYNITLAGGGSQIFGLGETLEQALVEMGGGRGADGQRRGFRWRCRGPGPRPRRRGCGLGATRDVAARSAQLLPYPHHRHHSVHHQPYGEPQG